MINEEKIMSKKQTLKEKEKKEEEEFVKTSQSPAYMASYIRYLLNR